MPNNIIAQSRSGPSKLSAHSSRSSSFLQSNISLVTTKIRFGTSIPNRL